MAFGNSTIAAGGSSILKGITNSIPGGAAITSIASTLGIGKKTHQSLTFTDIYGNIQHTDESSAARNGYASPEAERDAFLAKQRAAQKKQQLLSTAKSAAPFALIAVGGLLLLFVLKK